MRQMQTRTPSCVMCTACTASGEYGAAVGQYNKALRYARIRTYGYDNPAPLSPEGQVGL